MFSNYLINGHGFDLPKDEPRSIQYLQAKIWWWSFHHWIWIPRSPSSLLFFTFLFPRRLRSLQQFCAHEVVSQQHSIGHIVNSLFSHQPRRITLTQIHYIRRDSTTKLEKINTANSPHPWQAPPFLHTPGDVLPWTLASLLTDRSGRSSS